MILQKPASRLLIVLAFIAVYFIWGTTYLASIYALKGIPPFAISAFRYLIAGIILGVFAWQKGAEFPSAQSIKVLLISGIVMLVGGSGLIVFAEQYISSGSAAVLVATEPLWFILLDKSRWNFYLKNRVIIAGIVLGFLGIALFAYFTPDNGTAQSLSVQLPAMGLVLVSCVLWVFGTLYATRRIKSDTFNLWNTTIQLIGAGIVSGLIALFKGEFSHFDVASVPVEAWSGLAFLIIFGSLIAYLAFNWLVTVQPPAIVSTHTYVNPVIAVFIGWLMANEAVNGIQVAALILTLVGVGLTQFHKSESASQDSH